MSFPSPLARAQPLHDSPTSAFATARMPAHVAIIMDGNGRWAAARGLPRAEGHRRGVAALRRAVRGADAMGIRYLTVYGFSTENWSRPVEEIADLFGLLRIFIRRDLAELHQANVRVRIIGDRTGLDADVVALLDEAEAKTRYNTGLTFIVAFNYGGRQEIARAARALAERVKAGELDPAEIDADLLGKTLDTCDFPDPDLVIRTSGELRISNFLPWQTAYSEFVFLPDHWPDFDEAALRGAVEQFLRRDRRFGGRGTQTV